MNNYHKFCNVLLQICFCLLVVGGIISFVTNLIKSIPLGYLLVIGVIVVSLVIVHYKRERKDFPTIEKESESDKQSNLSPIILKEGDPNYYAVKLLQQKILTGSANNIAVAGIYGSGKSSVIETLKNIDIDHKYLSISLAKLCNREDIEESQIEYSILQQIFYKEDQNQFPFSKIRKVPLHTERTIIIRAINAIIFILSFAILFEPQFLRVETFCNWFDWGVFNGIGDLLAAIILLTQLFLIIFRMMPGILNLKGIKIAIQGNELELSNNESSIINKYLEEILYFFRNTDYDVVIFEDIDRFENPSLFIKLRELNLLLNNNKNIGRHISFIYALRDDTFTSESDRTKFFDYLVPIIPFVSRSNTLEILKEHLSRLGYTDLETEGLKEVALHIDDMRIIVNICNEFDTYKQCFTNKKVDDVKLLAILSYKNYFPTDFALLDRHDKKSKVYNCLSQADAYRKYAIDTYNKQGRDNLKAIHDKKEAVNKITELELRISALTQATSLFSGFICFKINNHEYSILDVAKNDTLLNEVNGKEFLYCSRTSSTNYGNLDLNKSYRELDPNYSFDEKIELLHMYQQNYVEESAVFDRLDKQIQSASIKELLTEFHAAESPDFKNLKLHPMMEAFILRGFIDESFDEYTSLFRAGEITKNDHDLLIDMGLSRNITWDRAIEKVDTLVDNIPEHYYTTSNILNYKLVDYHCEHWNESTLRRKSELLIDTIVNKSDNRRFLTNYYLKGNHKDNIFFELVNKHNVWHSWVISNDDSTLAEAWFKYCSKDVFSSEQYKWINQHFDFFATRLDLLSIKSGNDFRIKDAEFKSLSSLSSQLLDYVVANDLYELNTHNLSIILSYYNNGEMVSENDVNISRILACKEGIIKTWLDDGNLSILVNGVIKQDVGDENQEGLLFVINYKDLPNLSKRQYLTKQKYKIKNLSQVHPEYQDFAVDEFLIEPSWGNIQFYCEKNNTVPPSIKDYFSKYESDLLLQEYLTSTSNSFEILLLDQTWLSEKMFKYIAKHLNGQQYHKGLDVFSEEKLQILHELDLLAFTASNSSVLAEYPSVYHKYLHRYRLELCEHLDETPIGQSELNYFFIQSKNISVKIKNSLLEYDPIQNTLLNYPEVIDAVANHLINHYNKNLSHDFYLQLLNSITDKSLTKKLAQIIIAADKSDKTFTERLKLFL